LELFDKILAYLMHSLLLCAMLVYVHIYSVFEKEETKMFFVTSPTKLRRFWWNLVQTCCNITQFFAHLNFAISICRKFAAF